VYLWCARQQPNSLGCGHNGHVQYEWHKQMTFFSYCSHQHILFWCKLSCNIWFYLLFHLQDLTRFLWKASLSWVLLLSKRGELLYRASVLDSFCQNGIGYVSCMVWTELKCAIGLLKYSDDHESVYWLLCHTVKTVLSTTWQHEYTCNMANS